jgi:hypothetical protein
VSQSVKRVESFQANATGETENSARASTESRNSAARVRQLLGPAGSRSIVISPMSAPRKKAKRGEGIVATVGVNIITVFAVGLYQASLLPKAVAVVDWE